MPVKTDELQNPGSSLWYYSEKAFLTLCEIWKKYNVRVLREKWKRGGTI